MSNQIHLEKPYKYVAFISYRRADGQHARWLKRELLSYRLPVAMVKEYENIQSRNIKPVFLDQDDNRPGELSSKIHDAISSSKYLIVICSEHTNENPTWIDKEISYFLEAGNSPDHIIPLIVDDASSPETELFPPALQRLREIGYNGTTYNILGPSFYETGRLDRHKAFIRLIAGIHDIDPFIIEEQDKQITRRRRIRQFAYRVVIAVLVIVLLLIIWHRVTAPSIEFSSETTEANVDDTVVFTVALKNLSKEDSVKIRIQMPDGLEIYENSLITDSTGNSVELPLDIFDYTNEGYHENEIAESITDNNMTLSFEAVVTDENLNLGKNILYAQAFIHTTSHSYEDTVSINVTPQGSNISDDIIWGWGDNEGGRSDVSSEEYNAGELEDFITFNRISDGKTGHEFNFVAARDNNKGKFHAWHANEIFVEDKKTYTVRMYIHNLCCIEDNNVAKDVRAWFSLPTETGTQLLVNGIFQSSNATPSEYWDSVVFIGDHEFYLEYVDGSAVLQNAIYDQLSLPNELILSKGALLGYDTMDGNIPGGYPYDCVVTIQVTVHFVK